MFELPEAKRVRRDELHSPASSPRSSPDPALADLLRAQLASRIDIELVDAPQPRAIVEPSRDADDAASEDEELEFRLFAAPAGNAATDGAAAASAPQKIRIKSPDLESGDGGFINPERPRSYYFSGEPNEELRLQLDAAAVTGDQVMSWALQKWPGCALPWKVKTTALDRKAREALGISGGNMTEPATEKRKRKGKKARIATRTKLKAKAEAKEAQAKEKEEKELAERVKRAKRNREKKLKKRQRNKLKRAAAGEQDDGQPQNDSSGEDGDDVSNTSA
ncbi:hypothetical protein IWZ00DRAFT_267256 [Phyllosticta capitalensis]|uniref:uncharacterized protein n=1 Tax=Phyllosticta capitalensis TaxID=121624 RepID=UPI00312EA7B1